MNTKVDIASNSFQVLAEREKTMEKRGLHTSPDNKVEIKKLNES